jgi:hypothetical protein
MMILLLCACAAAIGPAVKASRIDLSRTLWSGLA